MALPSLVWPDCFFSLSMDKEKKGSGTLPVFYSVQASTQSTVAVYWHYAPIQCNAQLPQVQAECGGWSGLVGESITKFARGGGSF